VVQPARARRAAPAPPLLPLQPSCRGDGVVEQGPQHLFVSIVPRQSPRPAQRSDRVIRWFWQVLDEWSDDERAMLIRFAWGRETLPASKAEWRDRFRIARMGGEDLLPRSHTCFFQIDLPSFSSYEKAKHLLTIAIHCFSMLNG
jgi:hypothetical protein